MQNNSLNDSRINTVIMIAITSTMKFGEHTGIVILKKGEAGLSGSFVVTVSQIISVDRHSARKMIGTLTAQKMDDVRQGLRLEMDL